MLHCYVKQFVKFMSRHSMRLRNGGFGFDPELRDCISLANMNMQRFTGIPFI